MSFGKIYAYIVTGYSFITFGLLNYNKHQYEKYVEEKFKYTCYYSTSYYILNHKTNLMISIIKGIFFPIDILSAICYYSEKHKQINNIKMMNILFMDNPYVEYINSYEINEHYIGYKQYVNKTFLKSHEDDNLL